MKLSLNWDLDSIFEGGSQSPALTSFLETLTIDMTAFEATKLPDSLTSETRATWNEIIQTLYDLGERLNHVSSFIYCLVSQDVKDDLALQLMGQIDQLRTRLGTLWTRFSAVAAAQADSEWQELINNTDLRLSAFHLNEQREIARQKMSPELETLANELATDGYHAWDRLYGIVSGDKEVIWEEQPLSLGQLQNKFVDDPDRTIRERAFELYEASWNDLAKICAEALNHQAGFRLALYKHRGWDTVLREPLLLNRLQPETLEAMWGVIDAKSAKLLDYFAAKAQLFGLERLSWFDVYPPVGQNTASFTYDEAANFVIDNLGRLSPALIDFCRMAFEQRWIEAENRSGKRAGGYCTSFPLIGQSRIFMTFNDSYNGMLTLAHELGHAYHSWVMRDLPYGARRYTMSIAETASTFNELAVNDAGLRAARDDQERLSLLSSKLNDAVGLFMDLRARFDFELAFFERRAKKPLGIDELNELMLVAQKNAFKEGLERYHPLFWASKLHFYLTHTPFYNFPYTFGYLFSNGVYAQALVEGPSFQDRYVALLRDTGSMNTEQLALDHLGVDLAQAEFWEIAVDRVLADVDEFVDLAKELSQSPA